jgi:hypothetical protein
MCVGVGPSESSGDGEIENGVEVVAVGFGIGELRDLGGRGRRRWIEA